MATISFDFDGCLFDEEDQTFISETVSLLRKHIADGDRVIITTSRVQLWADEAKQLVLTRLKLDIPVFSCPGNPDTSFDWNRFDRIKSDVLIAEGAIRHFDDIPDCESLDLAKSAGIEILLPTATKSFTPRIY